MIPLTRLPCRSVQHALGLGSFPPLVKLGSAKQADAGTAILTLGLLSLGPEMGGLEGAGGRLLEGGVWGFRLRDWGTAEGLFREDGLALAWGGWVVFVARSGGG